MLLRFARNDRSRSVKRGYAKVSIEKSLDTLSLNWLFN